MQYKRHVSMEAKTEEKSCSPMKLHRKAYHLEGEAARPRDVKMSCCELFVAAEVGIVTLRSWRSDVEASLGGSTSQGPRSLSAPARPAECLISWTTSLAGALNLAICYDHYLQYILFSVETTNLHKRLYRIHGNATKTLT